MSLYQLHRVVPHDGVLVYLANYDLTCFKTGQTLREEVRGEVELTMDIELRLGPLPTLFMSPALIGTKRFCETLAEGCDNLELYPTVIRDPVDGREDRSYQLINVIGRVACTDMEKSEYTSLGPGMMIIDNLVLKLNHVPDADIFHVHEDPDCVVVSESLRSRLVQAGFADIALLPLLEAARVEILE
jgi:hypothetical protein